MTGTYWCRIRVAAKGSTEYPDQEFRTHTAFSTEEEAQAWVNEDPENREYDWGMG